MSAIAPAPQPADPAWSANFCGAWAVTITAVIIAPLLAITAGTDYLGPWSILALALPSAWFSAVRGVKRSLGPGAALAALCGYGTCVVSSGFAIGIKAVPAVMLIGLAVGTFVGLCFYVAYVVPVTIAEELGGARWLCARPRIVLGVSAYTGVLAGAAGAIALLVHDPRKTEIATYFGTVAGGFACIAAALAVAGLAQRARAWNWVRAVEAGRVPGYRAAHRDEFRTDELSELPRMLREKASPMVITRAVVDDTPYRATQPSPVLVVGSRSA